MKRDLVLNLYHCQKGIIQLDTILFKLENVFRKLRTSSFFRLFDCLNASVVKHPVCLQLQRPLLQCLCYGIGPYIGSSCSCAAQFDTSSLESAVHHHAASRTSAAQTSTLAPHPSTSSQKGKIVSEINNVPKKTEQHNGFHVHKNQTGQLSLIEVNNGFVQWSDHRRHLFGKFLLTD